MSFVFLFFVCVCVVFVFCFFFFFFGGGGGGGWGNVTLHPSDLTGASAEAIRTTHMWTAAG